MLETLNTWIAGIGVAMLVANLTYTVWVNWTRASREDLRERDERHYKQAEKIAVLDRRLSVMEEAFKHMPTHEDLTAIKTAVIELSGTTKSLETMVDGHHEQSKSMAKALDRIYDYMLQEGKRS